jgi:hypothetical protein
LLELKAAGAGNQALLAECAAHDLNHQPRRCLGGGTACRTYFGGSRIRYSRRRRASVYRWIRDLAAEISIRAGSLVITPAAWRVAARKWLVTNGLIKIERSEKVSPHFGPKSAHKSRCRTAMIRLSKQCVHRPTPGCSAYKAISCCWINAAVNPRPRPV